MSCPSGKRAYVNADVARAALRDIRTSHAAWNLAKIPTRFYRCQTCRAYHLTSMSKADHREATR